MSALDVIMKMAQGQFNNNFIDLAKQKNWQRNLSLARAQQQKTQDLKQQYLERIAQSTHSSHTRVNLTDAQKKSALQQHRNELKKISNAKKKKKLQKGNIKKYQKDIKKYQRTPWSLMYGAVGINVLGGVLTLAFGIGELLIVPATLFIDVLLWNALTGKERMQVRKMAIAATAIKVIPVVNLIPASAFIVYKAKQISQSKARKAKYKIKELQ